jgi:hypothetical protein
VRRLLCYLLICFLPLHSFAMQVGTMTPGQLVSIVHELDHASGVQHHHGDDGTVHYDHSDESAEHVSDQSAAHQPPGLPVPTMPAMLVAPSLPDFDDVTQFVPDPAPDGPLRPPLFSLG